MQFILSKVLSFLYYPINWIILLCIIAFFIKKISLRKKTITVTLLIFIIFSNKYIYNQISLVYQPKPISTTSLNNYSVGILLGGIASYDKNNIGFFGQSSDRFIQTLQLYKIGKIQKIIVSGGSSKILNKQKDEASFIYQSFINCGVNAKDILIEPKARNTKENFIYSKKILDSLGIKKDVVIITSAFHTPRTSFLASKFGFTNYIVFPCDYKEINASLELSEYILPNMKTMHDWGLLIKEWVGLIMYAISF